MKPSYCLLDRPWIPCLMPDGTRREFGLIEALCRAHEIIEISDPSPPVVASLHRLLLAVLHRVFGPTSSQEWRMLWNHGCFDGSRLDGYFSRWKHRFDLFDSVRPFYQVAGMEAKLLKSVSALAPQCTSGNNAVLFDHTADSDGMVLDAPAAARLLIVQQSFALGGLCGAESGRVSTTAAPLVAGAVVVAMGQTLFETTMLNLVAYDPKNARPIPADGDVPAWEHDQPATPEIRRPRGYLDYLTWQSRRLWLQPEPSPTGEWRVTQAIVTNAREFPRDYFLHGDPMLAYSRREKAKDNENPWPALRFSEDRALWRDSLVLLSSVTNLRQRPGVLDAIAVHVDGGNLPPESAMRLAAMGLCSNQAKMLFWRQERQPLPARYLSDEMLVGQLAQCLGVAETVGDELRKAIRLLAEAILAPGDRSPDKDVVTRTAAAFGTLGSYWSALEPRFHRLLVELAETRADMDATTRCWVDFVCQTATALLSETANGLPSSGRTLRAVTSAQRFLSGRLRKFAIPAEEVNHAAAE